MNEKTKTILKFVLFIIIVVFLTIIFWNKLAVLFSEPEEIRNYIKSFGVLTPVIFIVFIILQVLFAPIPGQAAGIAGGYIFGIYLGILYSMIGLIIGCFITFYLARKFGRPFVEKVVNKKTYQKFDKLIKKQGIPVLFLIYLLPSFPDDAINYLAGLTKIKMKHLMLVSAIGRLPGFVVLSFIGAGLGAGNTTFSIWLLAGIVIISILIFLNRKRLENKMRKIVKS